MRITRIALLVFFLVVSNSSYVFAEEMPPQPPRMSRAGIVKPPPPTKVPINEDIAFLIASALILGVTIIYRNKIKKASV